MSDPILVACLVTLRAEFNKTYPKRDKGADGWIGDTAHQQESSDHNPDETGRTPSEDADSINEVHALDIDKDLLGLGSAAGADLLDRHVEHIRLEHKAGRDNRLQNIIWRGKIASRSWGWTWHDYDGASAHFDHAHFSARYLTALESDTSPWGVAVATTDLNNNTVQRAVFDDQLLDVASTPKDGGTGFVSLKEVGRQVQVTKNRITELTVGPGLDGDPRSIYARLQHLETMIATLTATCQNMAAIVTKMDADPADEPPQVNPIVIATRYAIAHPE